MCAPPPTFAALHKTVSRLSEDAYVTSLAAGATERIRNMTIACHEHRSMPSVVNEVRCRLRKRRRDQKDMAVVRPLISPRFSPVEKLLH
jgi:hypothetical protein